MLKRCLLIVLSLTGILTSVLAVQAPAWVSAATPKDEICGGIGAANGSGGCTSDVSLNTVIRNIINIFSIIIGIAAVIMIMVSGFRYITAGGDSGNIGTAKNTLIYAIVGLVVAALSQFIVRFVLDKLK